ncbi:MAG: PAS domain S-box protein [Deltaproteobacteria bacterium]|nr:PAS domain S-box protein [Deltaproteobacteria bacterium]
MIRKPKDSHLGRKALEVETHAGQCAPSKVTEGRKETGKGPCRDEGFAHKVLSKSLNGIYIHDVRRERNVLVNDRFAELTGYNLKDLNIMEKAHFLTLFHPDDRQILIDHIDNVIRTGEDGPEIELRIRTKDGRWVWCLSRHSVFACNDDGSVSQIMGTFLDINDRKTAEQRLELENREVVLLNRIMRVFIEESGDELFDRVLDIVQEGLESRHGVFGYISKPGHLTCPSLSKMLDECEVPDKCIQYPPEKWKGLWARALRKKRSLYNNESADVPSGHPAIRNNLAAPILFQGEVIGLLNLANKEGDYTENDRVLLEAMAGRIAPLLYAWIQKKLREDERTEAEEGLRLLSQFPEKNPNPVLRCGLNGMMLYANSAARNWLATMGWKPGDPLPSKVITAVDEAQEQTHIIEIEITNPAGRTFSFFAVQPVGEEFVNIYGLDITEHKQAQEELRRAKIDLEIKVKERTAELQKAKELLNGVFETLPAYVVLLTADYHVHFANRFFRERFGESHGKPCYEYLFGRSEPCEICETYTVLKTMTPHRWEWTGPDGRNYDVYDFPFTDADGMPLIMEMGIDITERKQAEAAIHAERQRFLDVLELLPPMICLLTPDYHVTFTNRSFRQRFGESEGRRCYEYCFGRSEPCDFCEAYRVLDTGKPQHWEVEIPDGSVIEAHAFLFTDTDGSTLILGMYIDVTEQKRAEKALKDLNEKLEQRGKELQKSHDELEEKVKQRTAELATSIERLQESRKDLSHAQEVGQIGSWRLDLRRNALTWSDETYRIFDVPAGTPLTYETFLEIVHSEDRRFVDTRWNACLRGEPYDIEHRIVVNGKVKWVREKAYLELNNAGETIGAFGIAQDITERKAAEESIRASLSEKVVLLKEIHHRVKNNMQLISSLVALQADASEEGTIRDMLQDVTQRVRSMAMVHEKLYQSTDLARIDFAEYAQGLLNYLYRSYEREASKIHLITDLEPVSIPVNEAVPCGLILNELISNALKHAFPDHAEGEVVVSLHNGKQAEVVLCVRDNGRGLPSGFDWRQSRSLGLRLVQMLAGQLHADVEVSSDRGSEFKLIFRRPNK